MTAAPTGVARSAALTACHHARDVQDARLLLDVLGLVPDGRVTPPVAVASPLVVSLAAPPPIDATPPDTAVPDMSAVQKRGMTMRAAHGRCWACYTKAKSPVSPPTAPVREPPPAVAEAVDPVAPQPRHETGLGLWWRRILPDDTATRPGHAGGRRPGEQSDKLTDALLPALTDLIAAVRTRDPAAVAAAFTAATDTTGDPLAAAMHLAVMAADLARPDQHAQLETRAL